jgi:hypothetical protein
MSCLCLAVVAGEWLYVPGEAGFRNGFSPKTNQLAACGKAAPPRPSRGVGICSRGVRICSRGVRIWGFRLASPARPGRSGAVQRGRACRLGGQRTAVRISQVFEGAIPQGAGSFPVSSLPCVSLFLSLPPFLAH